jgi:hypothetical protein
LEKLVKAPGRSQSPFSGKSKEKRARDHLSRWEKSPNAVVRDRRTIREYRTVFLAHATRGRTSQRDDVIERGEGC